MLYEVKTEYTASVERKSAIGLWTKKHLVFKDGFVSLHDNDRERNGSRSVLINCIRSSESSEIVTLVGRGVEDTQVRFPDINAANHMVDIMTAALKMVPPKSKGGLPKVDPRNGLSFIDVPSDFSAKFGNLEKSVIYWFSSVKKFGSPSAFSRKLSVEDRVGFCGDKAFYLTKPNSEMTRCIKISKIKKLSTNLEVDGNPSEEKFLVIHMSVAGGPPEYDLCFSCNTLSTLLHSLESLYASLVTGQQLPVHRVANISDAGVVLDRPQGFTMTMVVPTSRDQLKKALDEYAKKNGIRFNTNGGVRGTQSDTSSLSGTDGQVLSPPSSASAVTVVDPLQCFLQVVECEKYFMTLYKQNVDLDILECMDETDLRTYGVTHPGDIEVIMTGVRDPSVMLRVQETLALARSSWKLTPAALPSSTRGEPVAAPTPLATAEAFGRSTAPVHIDLESDDDIVVVAATAGSAPQQVKQFQIVLDSDDDLELPPPAVSKPPLILDDDDI